MVEEKCHEWSVTNVQKSKNKRKGLQEGNENNNVWLGDGGTDQTGCRTGSGRVKDVEIIFGNDKDGQDQG